MQKRLAGKVAIVTGASKGIGAEIAKRLAAEGASVAVNYSATKSGAERVVEEITKDGGKAVALQANIAQKSDITKLFSETIKAFGRVDILVNNAGIYEFAPIEEINDDHFHRQFNLNVLGLLNAVQEGVKHFGKDGGSIINISSVVASLAVPNGSVYSATKGAVDALTRSLATELGSRQIRVNSINPGMVVTEGTQGSGIAESDMRKEIEKNTPLGRIGETKDIAPMAAFLASSDSAWITGETFTIAGGIR